MKTYIVENTKKYEEVKCFEDLSKHNIKVGKSYIVFNHGIHKIKLYYKNKSLSDACNLLNYEYGFGILCHGVYMYVEYREFKYFYSPKVDKNKRIQRVGTYIGNSKTEINILPI